MRSPRVWTTRLSAILAVLLLGALVVRGDVPQKPRPGLDVALARARLLEQAGDFGGVVATLKPHEGHLPSNGVLLLVRGLERTNGAQAEAVLRSAIGRFESDLHIRCAWVDNALSRRLYVTALQRCRSAPAELRDQPTIQWRMAQAWYRLDQLLGAIEVRHVPGGHIGQFADGYLLLEAREGRDQFLCCPPNSALYQLRSALDGGLDMPAAYVLHARIWQRAGRPDIARTVLRGRGPVLLADADDATLELFAELALEAGALDEYLRYTRTRVERNPAREQELLFDACVLLAKRYCRRGEEQLYIEWLYRACQLRPEDPDVLLQLGDALWSTGKVTDAGGVYRRLLRVEPNHVRRGELLVRIGQAGGEEGG